MRPQTPSGRRAQVCVLALIRVNRGSTLRQMYSAGVLDTSTSKYLRRDTLCSGRWAWASGGGKLSKGRICDNFFFFSQLILSLENVPNCSIVFNAVWSEGPESARYSRVSSAYILIFSVRSPTPKPLMSGFFRMEIARGSAASAYNNGDSGHPYFVPHVS